jgi:tetratricopeptide (TPR) repeat protein
MQRRELARGARDARDRGRHRGRHQEAGAVSTPLAAMGDYLAEQVKSHAVHLDTFARETAHIELGLGERLRQLAVYLECTLGIRAWSVLRPVYEAALKADPKNADTWSSQAIARKAVDADTPEVLRACLGSSRQAVALAPDDGHLLGHLGMLLYECGELAEAEVVLRKSIELGHGGWPHLWLAHALHDQERWLEASEAYAGIPAGRLPGWAAWRVQLARQQRASCLLRAGQRAEALATYTEVLDRYERALNLGMDADSSPVLMCGAPEYLEQDLPKLPEIRGRTLDLLARIAAQGRV